MPTSSPCNKKPQAVEVFLRGEPTESGVEHDSEYDSEMEDGV